MKERVVEFKPKPAQRDDTYPAMMKPRDFMTECKHAVVLIAEEARTVECEACKVLLDPVACMAKWAKKWDRERWSIRHEKELDIKVGAWLKGGGKIIVRPSGVVVEAHGRRWSSSCSGGLTEQLRNAIDRAVHAIKRAQPPKLPG